MKSERELQVRQLGVVRIIRRVFVFWRSLGAHGLPSFPSTMPRRSFFGGAGFGTAVVPAFISLVSYAIFHRYEQRVRRSSIVEFEVCNAPERRFAIAEVSACYLKSSTF